MSRIKEVSVCVARVPLDVVTSFATRTVTARDYCLVRVRSDGGQAGIGFCYVGSAGGRIAQTVVAELLAPKLIGQESLRVEGLWQELYSESLLHGRAGTAMRALGILDTALWDLNARTAGLPLYAYLGAVVTDKVPAYASGGYYLDGKTPEMLGEELASYVKSGFRAVKIKVGRLSPAEEEARMAAAREAVGDDVLLMLDANNAWRDLPTAMAYMNRYEPYDPYWIEEPFSPDDIDLHARLARSSHDHRGHRRDRLWTLVLQGTARQGRRRDPADRRRRLRRHHRIPAHRGDGVELRRDREPALVPRPACAPRRIHAQRALRRIFPRRPGAQFPPADRHAARSTATVRCCCRPARDWATTSTKRRCSAMR